MTKYHAQVSRGEKFWLIYVPEVERWTQARHLREVEPMARDLVQVMTREPLDSIEVAVEWPAELAEPVREFEQLQAEAEEARERAAQAQRSAARHLQEQGASVRDIGVMLHVSFQRAHQLLQA